ncbi:MAG: hypothetical protein M3Y09_07850 [Actinomycetota bacterium]|nr:hypothetical protein [Actinomycetota bacterium]
MPIVRYLQTFADGAIAFPGFENEMQGVTAGAEANGQPYHGVYCVKDA